MSKKCVLQDNAADEVVLSQRQEFCMLRSSVSRFSSSAQETIQACALYYRKDSFQPVFDTIGGAGEMDVNCFEENDSFPLFKQYFMEKWHIIGHYPAVDRASAIFHFPRPDVLKHIPHPLFSPPFNARHRLGMEETK